MLERAPLADIDAAEFESVLSEPEHDFFLYTDRRRIAVDQATMEELARNLGKHQTFFSDSDAGPLDLENNNFTLDRANNAVQNRWTRSYQYNPDDYNQNPFDEEISSDPEVDPSLTANEEDDLSEIPSFTAYLQGSNTNLHLRKKDSRQQHKIHKRAARIEQILEERQLLQDDHTYFALAQLSNYFRFSAAEFDNIVAIFEVCAQTNGITKQLCSVLFHELMFRYTPDFFHYILSCLQPLTSSHLQTIADDKSQELFVLINNIFTNHPATDEYIRVLFNTGKPDQYPTLLGYMIKEVKRGGYFFDWLTPAALQRALQSDDLTEELNKSRHAAMSLISYGEIDKYLNDSSLADILQAFAWLHANGMDSSKIAEAFRDNESAQKLISFLVKLNLLSDHAVQFHLHSAIILFAARASDQQSEDEYKQLYKLLKAMNHFGRLSPVVVSAILRTVCWQQKTAEFASMLEKFNYDDTVISTLVSDPLLHLKLHELFKQFDDKYSCHRHLLRDVDPGCHPAIARCLEDGIREHNYLEWLTPKIFQQAVSGKDDFSRIMFAANALHEIGCLHEYVYQLTTSRSFPAAIEILQNAGQLSPSKLRMIHSNHDFLAAINTLRSYGILNHGIQHSCVMRTAEQHKLIGMLITKPKLCQRIANYDSIANQVNDELLETYHENCRADLMMMVNHRFDVRFLSQHYLAGRDTQKRVAEIKSAFTP